MTQTIATQRSSEQTADKNAIRPFHVNIPEAVLADLRQRLAQVTRQGNRHRLFAGRTAQDRPAGSELLAA